MKRYALLAVALIGCGTAEDDRPPNLEYITQAILAPSCGNAQCHSAFHNAEGYTLDSVEGVRAAVDTDICEQSLLFPRTGDVNDVDSTLMVSVLLRNVDRMPYDQPLPEPDIALIREWAALDVKDCQ